MAITNTLRGLTAADRAKWEKDHLAGLQGLTKEQIDDIWHISRMHKMFGNRADYNDIMNMPKQKQIELYNNQTYLTDFTDKIGKQKEFQYRNGTVSFDYLNNILSPAAKAKLAKNPNFFTNDEIQKEETRGIQSADELQEELDKQPWWLKMLRIAGNAALDEGQSHVLGKEDQDVRIAKESVKRTADVKRKTQKQILEDVVNEDNLNFIKQTEEEGSVDKKLNEWDNIKKSYESSNPGSGEEFEQNMLQAAADMLNGKSVYFNGSYVKVPGSNYYKTFKNTDVFKDFTNGDKLRLYAMYNVLAEKKGSAYAMDAVESWMERYVHDHQTAGDWAKNTMNDIYKGGVANIANKLMGLEGIYVGIKYGEEGLGKWLNGVDPETGQPMTGFWENRFYNPNYWRKVEDYGTFDEREHEIIDQNGGISPYHNVYGTQSPSMWSWQTANEAAKMMKFMWSDYLVGRVLGAGSKFGTKLMGGKYAKTGEFLAKESPLRSRITNKVAAIGTVGMSAVGISEAYGKMTFDQVQRAGYDQIMKKIGTDVEKMVDIQMDTDNTKQVIENYVRAKSQQAAAKGWSNE